MFQGFPGDSVVKNLPADVGNARDTGSIFGRKIPWSRKWQPLQYSCLENSMYRGNWQATVHGVKNCWTQLSD